MVAALAPKRNNSVKYVPYWSEGYAVYAFKDHLHDCEELWHWGQFTWEVFARRYGVGASVPMSARAFYNSCSSILAQGRVKELKAWAAKNGSKNERFLQELRSICVIDCASFVRNMAAFLRSRGGLKGAYGPRPARPVGGMLYKRPLARFAGPWGALVRYQHQNLKIHMGWIAAHLDAGFVLSAGVVSGKDSRDFPVPEHYLLLLGHDGGGGLVFWDPDSQTSNRPPFGPTFGTLRHHQPSEVEFHRLTTAEDDEELKCAAQGDILLDVFKMNRPSTVDHPEGLSSTVFEYGVPDVDFRKFNHRYQVTQVTLPAI